MNSGPRPDNPHPTDDWNSVWHKEQPLICLNVIDQPLVDDLVTIIRQVWLATPKDAMFDTDLTGTQSDLLHLIISRR